MRRAVVTLLLCCALLAPFSAHAVVVKSGATCKKYGSYTTVKKVKFKCVKSGKKLVWKVVVAKSSPTPSPSPSVKPSPSATQSSSATPSASPKPSPSPSTSASPSPSLSSSATPSPSPSAAAGGGGVVLAPPSAPGNPTPVAAPQPSSAPTITPSIVISITSQSQSVEQGKTFTTTFRVISTEAPATLKVKLSSALKTYEDLAPKISTGSATDGVYTSAITLPADAVPGIYSLLVEGTIKSGSKSNSAAGSNVTITQPAATPTVSITMASQDYGVARGSTYRAYVRVVTNGTIASIATTLTGQSSTYSSSQFQFVSGTTNDGTYLVTVPVAAGALTGDYKLAIQVILAGGGATSTVNGDLVAIV